jgi:hypothetical protein
MSAAVARPDRSLHGRPVMATYEVHYKDGTVETVEADRLAPTKDGKHYVLLDPDEEIVGYIPCSEIRKVLKA